MTNQPSPSQTSKTEKCSRESTQEKPSEGPPFKIDPNLFTAAVTVEQTPFGSVPTLTLSARIDPPHRTLRASMHYLAMLAELASGPQEFWIIYTETLSSRVARLRIETIKGPSSQESRALAVLEDVCAVAFFKPNFSA